MNSVKPAAPALEDIKVPVKLKISALWVSLMFCYVYGDYFELYLPGKLQHMLEGKMPPLGLVTQGVLLGTATLMAVPSLMIFLSLVLKPSVNRWANIILGTFYAVIMLMVIPGTWAFYLMFGIIEIALSLLIVWYAWRWPRREAAR